MSTQYTATVEAKVPQLVHCTHCDFRFIYEMVVSGTGSGETGLFRNAADARTAAKEKALARLSRRLNKPTLCEAIPCPKCYRYQSYMHRVAARERYTDYGCLALPFGVLCAAVVCVAAICWNRYPDTRSVAALAGVAAVAVWLAARSALTILRLRIEEYDPNTQELSGRERLADKRAVLLADFDAAQAKRVRREYKKYAEAVRTPRWGGSSFEVPEPLVADWWFTPSVMLNGGSVVIDLPGGESVTVHVPEDCLPGEVLDVHTSSREVLPFQVRVLAIRVHPDEQRLE
ncbi:MAG: hypothetical protein J0I06_25750 [Planctomycetes bacterium]|nr:hypothetical protein [Planctomycetota bacterium]